ncbi:MAG TPA: TonB family protein [Terracidiphilus sp.]|nr:TonB family protein [Terracidiphilus sp.]
MSTTVHNGEPEAAGSSGMSIALVGPNNSHRKTVAKALSGSGAKTVREFDDYPATLSDVPRMMEQNFDVVMIDVDSDQSYALALIERIVGLGKAMVIAYSQRNDPQLLMTCMQAGAREFLPLPDENQSGAASDSQKVEEAASQENAPSSYSFERPNTPETNSGNGAANGSSRPRPKEAPAPEPAPLDFNEWDSMHLRPARKGSGNTPELAARMAAAIEPPIRNGRTRISKELHVVPLEETKPAEEKTPSQQRPAPRRDSARENSQPRVEKGPEDRPKTETKNDTLQAKSKREWDDLWATTAPLPDVGSPEAGSTSEVSAELPAQTQEIWDWTNITPTATKAPPEDVQKSELSAAELSAVAKDHLWLDAIASESQPRVVKRPDMTDVPTYHHVGQEESKKDRNWSVWILLAMGFGVLVCLLWAYFIHPFGQKPSANVQTQSVVVEQPASPPQPVQEQKPAAGTSIVPPIRQSASPDSAPPPAPVSSDEMNEQLAAPARISGEIKKPIPVEGPPPAGVTSAAIETSSSVPGAVFGGGSKLKVVPVASAISAGVAEGMLIRRTTPVYPEFAKQGHITGVVVLGATITKSGTIQGLHVISGPEIFRGSAMEAVKTWRYRPYTLDNQPVAVDTTIKLVFSLNGQ